MKQHKIFPKEGTKKLKETIRDLKSQIKELEARNDFLEKQLNGNISQEPNPEDVKTQTSDEAREAWRKDFLRRVKENK